MEKRTRAITRADGTIQQITSYFSLSAQDTAIFSDGGPVLVLTREEYRSIQLVDEPDTD